MTSDQFAEKAHSDRSLTCEDCGDPIEPGCRRIRCKNCKSLVCGWCYHHSHGLGYRKPTPEHNGSRAGR